MVEHFDNLLYKLRFAVVILLTIGVFFLISVLITSINSGSQNSAALSSGPETGEGYSLAVSDNANAVTVGLASALASLDRTAAGTQARISDSLHSVGTSTAATSQAISHGGTAALHSVSNGFAGIGHMVGGGVSGGGRIAAAGALAMTRGIGGSMIFAISMPANVLSALAETTVVSAAIQPTPATAVPTIDPNAPVTLSSASFTAAPPAAKPAAAPVSPALAASAPQWPIHGAITTYFGASDWPYQLHHTGIDISDGRGSGVTPVHPFKPGTIAQVIHGSTGLGNHIVIDHGGGMTSVYGHLYSTSVSVGQKVDESTVLGLEGTTGASTGPHVHFEIRINNQPMNPMSYIAGRP